MAQTKRKRRTKHRGNAAGVVESRGRTGRPPTDDEKRKARESARQQRMNKPPTWNSAFLKAALMAGILFLLINLGLFGSKTNISQSLVLCVFAILFYTPIAYVTDKWVYTRNQKRLQQQKK